ncbi:MAG: MoxR family ATPase [Sulfurimonadaceae bacterium]|nr:MoxR family ATPase [Sulfurimonadaceae bacterium]
MQNEQEIIQQIIDEVQKIIKGKERQVRLALAAFLAGGHVMIEDLPGVGKTTLAKTLARVLGLGYGRIQFTSDLLPSDILGVNYFDTKASAFVFKKGPVFSQFLLADEINRATPKTQSALLEAMEEAQVSVEGEAMPLERPFFVMATKNPFEEVGTFELPDSQLDRFLISFSLGYPDREAERSILKSEKPQIEQHVQSVGIEACETLFEAVHRITLSDALLDYMQNVIAFTRDSGLYRMPLSTRGALALAKMTRAWALLEGRDYAIPADVKNVLPYVCAHRLVRTEGRHDPEKIIDEIFEAVPADE